MQLISTIHKFGREIVILAETSSGTFCRLFGALLEAMRLFRINDKLSKESGLLVIHAGVVFLVKVLNYFSILLG